MNPIRSKSKFIKKVLFYFSFCLAFLLGACNRQNNKTNNDVPATSQSQSTPYKNIEFASDKDLVCGMPLKYGVGDTAHYEGKIYGFCSTVCKDEFLKSPASYSASK
jgi:YHS domain-containing protein